jgi:hypothetical protein
LEPFSETSWVLFEVEEGMNAGWDLERGEQWFICMPTSQQAHGYGRYCKFAIVLSQSSHMGFEMTDLVTLDSGTKSWMSFTGFVQRQKLFNITWFHSPLLLQSMQAHDTYLFISCSDASYLFRC